MAVILCINGSLSERVVFSWLLICKSCLVRFLRVNSFTVRAGIAFQLMCLVSDLDTSVVGVVSVLSRTKVLE